MGKNLLQYYIEKLYPKVIYSFPKYGLPLFVGL